MHALENAGTGKLMHQLAGFGTVLGGINQLCLSGTGDLHLSCLVYIAVSMSCDGNGFFPVLYAGFDSLHYNGSAEYGSVKDGTDGSIGALPHFL